MSFHAVNHTNSATPIDGSFRAFAAKMSLMLVRKYRAYKTAKALSLLSDTELEDIGLVRADIPKVAARTSL
ncbi:DUF1127 domain-containing protein [Sneathiella glossodoripedis]|uniref:DUF1127 domain-containing protein n=1 Tax=Sneathiella glossodoripedis TaxID=418853 RepID=UPI000472F426|nr:DUF1127 domain-containing protein [Sneathiella glossodoripedis]